MKPTPTTNTSGIDLLGVLLFITFLALGWTMIYAVGYEETKDLPTSTFLLKSSAGKQLIFIGICSLLFFAIQFIDWKFWRTFSYVIYIFSLVLLFLVLFLGNNIKGATSWFVVAGFSFQPSEFAKFGTCLALSSYLSTYSTSLKNLNHQLISFGLILAPIILILLQPDAGSALVFLSFFILLFREGLSVLYYLIGGFIAIMFILGLVFDPFHIFYFLLLIEIIILGVGQRFGRYAYLVGAVLIIFNIIILKEDFWVYGASVNALVLILVMVLRWRNRGSKVVKFSWARIFFGVAIALSANLFFNNMLKPHQQERINVWLNPSVCDPRGSLYNVLQSKVAIGSGGVWGKGFLNGNMTKLNYVPEQSTDFIFCTVGEEQGLKGSIIVIGLFTLLLYRLLIMAERSRAEFSRHFIYGVSGIIFVHLITNVGMTMGLLPIIGIPLPFISYGGSSLLGFTILMAVVLKLDSDR